MCCMNLADHSESIHKKLSQLQDNMKKLRVTEKPYDDWLKGWGITGWSKTLLMEGMKCLLLSLLC